MANLAIIPARGGSKRIPGKNIKALNNKPIISHTIETLLESNLFDEVMVSTDSEEIANVAIKSGAKVPFLRSEKNADDFSTLSDVLIEVIHQYKKEGRTFDNICCMLPTSALINSETLIEAFKVLQEQNFITVVPVLRFSYPIQRALKNENGLLELNNPEYINTRTQDLPINYHDSGQFYWLETERFLEEHKIFTKKTGFIELKEYEAQDVDTFDDWKMLELKYKLKN